MGKKQASSGSKEPSSLEQIEVSQIEHQVSATSQQISTWVTESQTASLRAYNTKERATERTTEQPTPTTLYLTALYCSQDAKRIKSAMTNGRPASRLALFTSGALRVFTRRQEHHSAERASGAEYGLWRPRSGRVHNYRNRSYALRPRASTPRYVEYADRPDHADRRK